MSDITQTAPTAGTLQRCSADDRDLTQDDIEQELVQVYAETAPGLLRYAVTLVRDMECSRDALQEVFLKYFIARQNGQRFANPKAWLFRVLRNHLFDILKSATFNNEIQLCPYATDLPYELDNQYRQTELNLHLEKLLSARELECVRLRSEGLRYDQIADVLEVRPGTVGAMLTRIHKKLRRAMRRPACRLSQMQEPVVTAPTGG